MSLSRREVILLALLQSACVFGEIITKDYSAISQWQQWTATGVTNPKDPFDARNPSQQNGDWWHLVNGGPGTGLDINSKQGWRLRADHSNEVVLRMGNITDDNPLIKATYVGEDNDLETPQGIQHFPTVGKAIFTASNSTKASDESLWTSTDGFTPTGWAIVISLTNGCQDTKTLTATATDTAGKTQTTTVTDFIFNYALDQVTVPFNLTVTSKEYPDDLVTVQYFDYKGLTYKVGSGETEPTVPPSDLDTSIFWCDPD